MDTPQESTTIPKKTCESEWEMMKGSVDPRIINYITDVKGFDKMRPVQKAAIPFLIGNVDVCVQAETGSGKTLAYILPAIQCVLKLHLAPSDIGVLIILPTRELAQQVYGIAKELCSSIGIEVGLAVGGEQIAKQCKRIENHSSILIGTPGRLYDLLGRNNELNIKTVELLVLDEADRLLDMGFYMELNSIISKLSRQRRTGLFSATQSREIKDLARAGMRNPRLVVLNGDSVEISEMEFGTTNEDGSSLLEQAQVPESLSCYYCFVPEDRRVSSLLSILETEPHVLTVVFALTCAWAELIGTYLVDWFVNGGREKTLGIEKDVGKVGRNIHVLHGQLVSQQRNQVMRDVEDSSNETIIVATDLAARGLDINDISLVIQMELPQGIDTFIHRIGRTARAGKEGTALCFMSPHEDAMVEALRTRGVKIGQLPHPPSKMTMTSPLRNLVLSETKCSEGVPQLVVDGGEKERCLSYPEGLMPSDVEEFVEWEQECKHFRATFKDKRKELSNLKKDLTKTKEVLERGKKNTVRGSETERLVNKRTAQLVEENEMQIMKFEKELEELTGTDPSARETMMTKHPIIQYLRSLALERDDVFHQGQKAFISWVRAYNERKESGIFDSKRAPLGACATGMGLTKLPHLREFTLKYVPFCTAEGAMTKKNINTNSTERKGKGGKFGTKTEDCTDTNPMNPKRREQKDERPSKKEPKTKAQKGYETELKKKKDETEMKNDNLIFKRFKAGKISKAEYESLMWSV